MIVALRAVGHVVERNVLSYRRMRLVFIAGFVEPIFYLFGLGLGLGGLIGGVSHDGVVIDYATFVAPGLIAASAMNGAIADSTFNFYFKLRYAKTFDAMLNTPLTLSAIVVGEITWAMLRAGIYAAVFLALAAAMGLVVSWWAVLVVPASLAIGLGFSAIGVGLTTLMRSWHDFDYIGLMTQPLFLCSTTFFALDVFPSWAQPLVVATPLYHGVALCRDLTLGTVGLSAAGHLLYLIIMAMIGIFFARRRLDVLLRK